MVKKLNGDLFIYSANSLLDGRVIYFSKNKGWTPNFDQASIIKKEMILSIEKVILSCSDKHNVINPYLIEVDKNGRIIKLRERIRLLGLRLQGQYNV
tara:strand:+ start:4974 stop:5264 length:291 start_codon:yes stop_codon:yes gene_type:complete